MKKRITDYIENKKLSFDLTDPYFKFHVDTLFKEENGYTLISEDLKGNSKNHFFNAMMRVFGHKSKRVKAEQFDRLKSIIESGYKQIEKDQNP